jgi:hypothetical protein
MMMERHQRCHKLSVNISPVAFVYDRRVFYCLETRYYHVARRGNRPRRGNHPFPPTKLV